jgi:hypothetical protein
VSCVQYISGTQLNQDTLSDDNPLFVVNGRWEWAYFLFIVHSSAILRVSVYIQWVYVCMYVCLLPLTQLLIEVLILIPQIKYVTTTTTWLLMFYIKYMYVCMNECVWFRANLNFDPPVRKIKPVIQDAIQIQNTAARQTAWWSVSSHCVSYPLWSRTPRNSWLY